MFAFLLGLTWLVLTPVCVWLLFARGQRGALRAAGALTLASLQAATMVLGFTQRPGRTPAETVAAPGHRADAPAGGGPTGGRDGQDTPDTQNAQDTRNAQGMRGTGATPVATPPFPTPSGPLACDPRVPNPEAVRLSFRGRALHGLTVYWPASPAQCDTATVAVHQAGHRLRIWVSEGAEGRHHEGTHHVPVRVEQGMASLSLRLGPIVRHHRRYVAIDGHTGDKIPLRSRRS